MSQDRATTSIRLKPRQDGWEISFGNEALIIPAPVAEAMARRILGLDRQSDIAKAALAVAAAR